MAGALLALALFFGLRGLAPGSAAVPPAVPAAAEPPPAPPAPVVDLAVAQQHAINALAYHRSTLRQACYLPLVVGEAPPPRIAFQFNFTFDPEGIQITRGVAEARGAARPVITACVLAKLPALRIPRPGRIVEATVPLSFP